MTFDTFDTYDTFFWLRERTGTTTGALLIVQGPGICQSEVIKIKIRRNVKLLIVRITNGQYSLLLGAHANVQANVLATVLYQHMQQVSVIKLIKLRL